MNDTRPAGEEARARTARGAAPATEAPGDDRMVDAYLDRLGVARPAEPDVAALRELHLRHLRTVPFENLSIHLGEEVVLDHPALLHKVVVRRRGGFCYELNGAFAWLLTALGYTVELLSARMHGPNGFGPPFDHLALRVTVPGDRLGPWLADVGAGNHCHLPLRLADRGEQSDPVGSVFRIVRAPDGDLDVVRDGEPSYRLEPRARTLSDFLPTCWYQCTSAHSHFTANPICSRVTDEGRISISGRTLVRTAGSTVSREPLADDEAVLAAYREHFGIVLDRVPAGPGRPTDAPG